MLYDCVSLSYCFLFIVRSCFLGWVFLQLGGRHRYRYEYIVADTSSQLDCERILGMEWYDANSTVIGKDWEGGRVIESH